MLSEIAFCKSVFPLPERHRATQATDVAGKSQKAQHEQDCEVSSAIRKAFVFVFHAVIFDAFRIFSCSLSPQCKPWYFKKKMRSFSAINTYVREIGCNVRISNKFDINLNATYSSMQIIVAPLTSGFIFRNGISSRFLSLCSSQRNGSSSTTHLQIRIKLITCLQTSFFHSTWSLRLVGLCLQSEKSMNDESCRGLFCRINFFS